MYVIDPLQTTQNALLHPPFAASFSICRMVANLSPLPPTGASSAHAAERTCPPLRLSASVVPRSQLSRFRMIWIHIHDSVVSDGQVLPVKLADARALARQDWVLVLEEHRLELLTETVGVFAPQRQLHFRAGIVAKLDRTLRFSPPVRSICIEIGLTS